MGLNDLKKQISGSKEKKKKRFFLKKSAQPSTGADLEKVDEIVSKMKKKYKEQGISFEKSSGKLGELRSLVDDGKTKIEIQAVSDLKDVSDQNLRTLGNYYLKFEKFFSPVYNLLMRLPLVKELDYYLYSANMPYSSRQWVAVSSVIGLIFFIFSLVLFALLFLLIPGFHILLAILLPFLIGFILMLVVCFVILTIPKNKANKRASNIDVELPFALRHMGTELKAGLGLYRTIQAIAVADYGDLSEEFARTINEIEEGADTKDALRHLALRTRSKNLRNALMHIIRAMKTGGNLSNIMDDIAEDVSDELFSRMRGFSQVMNFIGVMFIFLAIVGPVAALILGSIKNSPIGLQGSTFFSQLPLGVDVLSALFLIGMPLAFFILIYIINMIQPRT